jgi:hypothetical protein
MRQGKGSEKAMETLERIVTDPLGSATLGSGVLVLQFNANVGCVHAHCRTDFRLSFSHLVMEHLKEDQCPGIPSIACQWPKLI